MLNTLWIHFRRFVMSLMLVAMASFVLHGGALARLHQHGQRLPGCQEAAHTGHGHQQGHQAAVYVHKAAHEHGNGVAPHHARGDAANQAASDGSTGGKGGKAPCCASACPVAMAAPSIDPIAAPMTPALTLVPGSDLGSGIEPGHPKRPPRPLDTA